MENLRKYFIIIFSALVVLTVSGISSAEDETQPSPAPAMPSAYWLESGKTLKTVGIEYLRFSSDYFSFRGYGLSLGVDNFWERIALSFSGNVMYMSGESEDSSSDFTMNGGAGGLGMNLNFLAAGSGSASSFHLNIFGGGSVGLSSLNGSYSNGSETDMGISSRSLGLQAGLQLYIPLGDNIGLIPFGMLKHDKISSTITIETEGSEDQEDTSSTSFTSKIIGFDIHIMQISIGSLFQMRPDDDMIFFHFSYSWI